MSGNHPTSEQHARRFLELIEEGGRAALSKLTDDDRAAVEKGLKHLRPAFDELSKWFIEPLRETKPSRADHGYHQLWTAIGRAWALGSRSTVTDGGNSYFQSVRGGKGGRPPNPIDDKIMAELQAGGNARSIARRLRQAHTSAFKMRVSRVKNRQPKN